MKVLLICAAGMSTSILMKKMTQYAQDQAEPLEIRAVGLMEYLDFVDQYDVLLLGPQVAYRLDTVKASTAKPAACIPAMDYALGDCPHIFGLIHQLIA